MREIGVKGLKIVQENIARNFYNNSEKQRLWLILELDDRKQDRSHDIFNINP